MRKVFFWTVAFAVGGLLQSASACEFNRESTQPAIILDACNGSDCLVRPELSLIDEKRTDPVQDCGAAYFDPSTYSGSDGLFDWLVASLDTQSQYKLGAGFGQSPMDANAQYR